MILAALLLPVAVLAIVVAIQRLRLPPFLAVMGAIVAYGIAAQMTWQSIGKAFGLGFVSALEQVGLLVVAGSLAGTLLLKRPLNAAGAGVLGVLAGLGGAPAAALALLQPAGRAVALLLTILIVQALVVPSPLAVAAMSVLHANLGTTLSIGLPLALVLVVALGLWSARRERGGETPSWHWLAIVVPLALLIAQAVAQMPTEPLGKGGARELYTGISRALFLAVLAIALAMALSRRWQPEGLADTRWATLLLTVGAAGGLARVLDETGMAELLAERAMDPRLGLLAPFLAAAIVKTMQGNPLSAVLTASGMVEPMLPALGLDSASGRALAAAATGVGAMAVVHVNDPLFWIAADMGKLSPARALLLITGGSAVVAAAAMIALLGLRLVL
ncbi:MAG: GntP family permease [Proteobacteria bacterium]|nr:GntP family permease [Pseudomonadota bacterium]